MIYIIEDDQDIREMETYALKNSGFEVEAFSESGSFYEACRKSLPSLVLLDIMLPGEDGLAILKKLRQGDDTKDIPVIMVTAKSTEIDKVKGLDSGADDYITKPFGVMELVSRAKALLRRCPKNSEQKVLSFQGIVIDDDKHTVTVDGKECKLTFKEYELLKYFLQNKGIALSRERLIEQVWGYDFEGESRTVDMHIKTLRQKLGSAGSIIKTVRNVGYKAGE
ncbi:MAG: response regulator transcription factor [bacterium]|nr:response regulator transcription factor [bacterium]MDY3861627.1 response regulator transcription factor [Ruminococcus sp.]